jgi:hypothetical protein
VNETRFAASVSMQPKTRKLPALGARYVGAGLLVNRLTNLTLVLGKNTKEVVAIIHYERKAADGR